MLFRVELPFDFTFEPRYDKTNKSVRPPKTQISLASAQSDQSSLCAQWVAKDPSFLHVDSEDSDQSGRMPRLIWVFTGSTVILFVLSCRGSFLFWSGQNNYRSSMHMHLTSKAVKRMHGTEELKQLNTKALPDKAQMVVETYIIQESSENKTIRTW